MIKQAFMAVDTIDNSLDADLMEISVKQSQMTLTFFDELIIQMADLDIINKIADKLQVTDVTCFHDQLYVSLRGIKDEDSFGNESLFLPLYHIITVLRDVVCACPALEYVISKEYLKVYLDVPNIKVSNLWKLADIFEQDPFVEFTNDRPYLLFLNEDLMQVDE